MTSQTPKKCYVENDFVVCFCGKCKPEDYKLPSDYLIMTSQTLENGTKEKNIVSLEQAQQRLQEMKTYLDKASLKDAVHQCFFERGWSVTDFENIKFDTDSECFNLQTKLNSLKDKATYL